MRQIFRRHPLLLFFLLAFAGFWGCLALDRVPRFHFWAPMLGVFAAAVASLTVTGVCEGEDAIRKLVGSLGRWRVQPQWYAVALGLPVAQALMGIALALPLHKFKSSNLDNLGAVLPSMWIFFLFAVGEELGWRGFALPRLLERYGPVWASLILGALHSVWHWPLILPQHGLMHDLPPVTVDRGCALGSICFYLVIPEHERQCAACRALARDGKHLHAALRRNRLHFHAVDQVRHLHRHRCGGRACNRFRPGPQESRIADRFGRLMGSVTADNSPYHCSSLSTPPLVQR